MSNVNEKYFTLYKRDKNLADISDRISKLERKLTVINDYIEELMPNNQSVLEFRDFLEKADKYESQEYK